MTGEKILNTGFLVKEEASRNTVCSFRRNNRRYWSEIRSISTKNFKMMILENWCIKLTCTHSQIITLFETMQIYFVTKIPGFRVFC